MGYHVAGYEVVGVDIKNQRNYPFEFVKGDALEYLAAEGHKFDAIHASPPCQAYSITGNLARAQGKKASEIDLVEPTRELLVASGKPYVIENVPGAPLINPVTLCGSMFNLQVRRHRVFESSVALGPAPAWRQKDHGRHIGVYVTKNDSIPQGGKTASTLEEGQEAMGIDWMPWSSLILAIPPIYTTWVGLQLQGWTIASE